MPTPEWFAENPKISAYISKDLDDALKAWMVENRIKKVSQALTTILEQHLGLAKAPQTAAGNYATLEQLQGLVVRVEALERENKKATKPKSPSKPEGAKQMSLGDAEPTEGEWMTSREAHKKYGGSSSYEAFRQYSPKTFLEKFRIEADPNRKKKGGPPDKWLRKV